MDIRSLLRGAFAPVSNKELAVLLVFSVVYGAIFVNYIEYYIFSTALINASVPPAYHIWLEIFYTVPFLTLLLFRKPLSIVLVYVLGRIASLANDFAYPIYAKYVFHDYDGGLVEWWAWLFGFGPEEKFSWIVKMGFVEYQMTSTIMAINLVVRLVIIAGFFLGYFYMKRMNLLY
jgi:hypothetical protein